MKKISIINLFLNLRSKLVNLGENAFGDIPVGADEPGLVSRFLDSHDFAAGTRRGIVLDLRKLARWFTEANREPFVVGPPPA